MKINHIEIACDAFGDHSAPAVLLISGLGAQMLRWTPGFCLTLARRGFRVIRFDNRDAGLSTHFSDTPTPDFASLAQALASGVRPNLPYTLHTMMEDAMGVLDAMAVARAHVVGRSMGGMIAQLMASEHPERVLSLTSIMSSTGNPALPSAAPDVMALMTSPAPDPFVDEEGYLEHRLAFAQRISSPGFAFDRPAQRDMILQELRRAYDPGSVVRQIAALVAAGDLRQGLAKVTAPTLVIHGADDVLIPAACGRDTAQSIAHAQFKLIAGMGHDVPCELYEMLADAIAANAARAAQSSGLQS